MESDGNIFRSLGSDRGHSRSRKVKRFFVEKIYEKIYGTVDTVSQFVVKPKIHNLRMDDRRWAPKNGRPKVVP